MIVHYKQSLICKLDFIFKILITQFLIIICLNENPKEIQENYIQIIHLLDSETFKHGKNLVYSYNS